MAPKKHTRKHLKHTTFNEGCKKTKSYDFPIPNKSGLPYAYIYIYIYIYIIFTTNLKPPSRRSRNRYTSHAELQNSRTSMACFCLFFDKPFTYLLVCFRVVACIKCYLLLFVLFFFHLLLFSSHRWRRNDTSTAFSSSCVLVFQ